MGLAMASGSRAPSVSAILCDPSLHPMPPLMPTTSSPTPSTPFPSSPSQALWLVRPRSDGGSDYVNFVPSPTAPDAPLPDAPLVEIREGSHLPPQMPLLKRRRRLGAAEAEACRRHLQQEAGFHHSEPLF